MPNTFDGQGRLYRDLGPNMDDGGPHRWSSKPTGCFRSGLMDTNEELLLQVRHARHGSTSPCSIHPPWLG